MYILGIHLGHDASAVLIRDGQVLADVQEERFNRIKHSFDLPIQSIQYCLEYAGIHSEDLDAVAFAKKLPSDECALLFPDLSYPASLKSEGKRFLRSLGSPLMLSRTHKKELPVYVKPFKTKRSAAAIFVEHHLAHAASAYYTSGLSRDKRMLIATIDGVGDGVSCALWRGENGKIDPLLKYGPDSSLGWFYSNVTEALGWQHGDGEGTLMGLAPYGDRTKAKGVFDGYYPVFENGKLIRPHSFGLFAYIDISGSRHYHFKDSIAFHCLLDRHRPEDLAIAAQDILEEEVKEFIFPWLEKEDTRILGCAGGIFLNVKLNQRIWNSGKVDIQHIYPNAGDSGLAAGAALHAYYQMEPQANIREIDTLYKGPAFTNEQIEKILKDRNIPYERSENVEQEAANDLAQNKIVGWFQGRMESGPRALGNRSILMSANNPENKTVINAKVKFRQAFRPFCPSILAESRETYLSNSRKEEYMITSFDVSDAKRDKIPAVVHKDGTLRPQLVFKEKNERYYRLIQAFATLTGESVLLNTSLNIKGEPMICNPREAIKCFYDNGIDTLMLGDYVLRKPGAGRK